MGPTRFRVPGCLRPCLVDRLLLFFFPFDPNHPCFSGYDSLLIHHSYLSVISCRDFIDRTTRSSPLLDPPVVSGGLSGNSSSSNNNSNNSHRFWALGADPTLVPYGSISAAGVELFPSVSRDAPANLAALAIPPAMGSALEALNPSPPPPLSARRPAAPALPSFELPPPSFNPLPVKYPSASAVNPGSVSSLLDPNPAAQQHHQQQTQPPHQPDSAAPPVTTASTAASTPGDTYWAHTPYGSRSSWPTFSHPNAFVRPPPQPSHHTTSPPGVESISPSYDLHQLPPFHQQPPPSSSHHHHQPHHPHHPAALFATTPGSAPPPPPLPSNDPYMTKSSSAPSFGTGPLLTTPPTPGGYPPYGTGLGLGRMASSPHAPPYHLNHQRQPWPSYSLPAMTGPVMTNVHSPGGQMSMLGGLQTGMLPAGFNSGHVASMQHMYPHAPPGHGPHGHGPGPTTDRPFKCDQCPQSFNRNHDLKRHKRIHLSVKPFPCNHCDKSFSRKDALKVAPPFLIHCLVEEQEGKLILYSDMSSSKAAARRARRTRSRKRVRVSRERCSVYCLFLYCISKRVREM